MGTPGSVRRRHDAVRLNPAHVKRECDEDEGNDGQYDTQGQKFDRAIGIVTILDQAEHAGAEAEYDKQQQNRDNDFDN